MHDENAWLIVKGAQCLNMRELPLTGEVIIPIGKYEAV